MMDGIGILRRGDDLTYGQAADAARAMLSGKTGDSQNADFLSCLAAKGETDEELLGMLDVMGEMSVRLPTDLDAVDVCGTGGDGLSTFNISTAASFVLAAAGGTVAKHGNRSSTGGLGSADIFEHLGCNLHDSPDRVAWALGRHHVCFMFAQRFHPAMRHVREARRRLGTRTAFNILGPLLNPAGVRRQLVGVSSGDLLERVSRILQARGSKRVMTVMSGDGMDEFSTSSTNRVLLASDGMTESFSVDPEDVGLHRCGRSDLQVNNREEAFDAFLSVLDGSASRAMTETAALNAAGGMVVAGLADGIADGAEEALEAIRGGRAYRTLEGFVADMGDPATLQGRAA